MTFKTLEYMKGWMEDAGFVDVVEKKFVWPIGPWARDPRLKDMGRWGERNWADGLEGWVLALYTRVLGVSDPFFFPVPFSLLLSLFCSKLGICTWEDSSLGVEYVLTSSSGRTPKFRTSSRSSNL